MNDYPLQVGLPREEAKPREGGERVGPHLVENLLHSALRLRGQREQKGPGRPGFFHTTESGRALRVLPKGNAVVFSHNIRSLLTHLSLSLFNSSSPISRRASRWYSGSAAHPSAREETTCPYPFSTIMIEVFIHSSANWRKAVWNFDCVFSQPVLTILLSGALKYRSYSLLQTSIWRRLSSRCRAPSMWRTPVASLRWPTASTAPTPPPLN